MRTAKDKEDKASAGLTDMKKMFSAHVQENLLLNKQRSDLDSARVKKLRELNHNASAFMRKYEKYAVPSRQRRHSVDMGTLTSAGRSRSRADEGFVSQKSLGRQAITNDCPYSLDTWNLMVGADKQYLEENKNTLISDGIGETKGVSDNPPTTPRLATPCLLTNRERTVNTLHPRRNSLTPLCERADLFENDTVDEEIVSIQKPAIVRQRRHSLHPIQGVHHTLSRLPKRRLSVDTSIFLPKLPKSLSIKSTSDTDVSNSRGHVGQKSVLKKPAEDKMRVANATVFVRNEDGFSEQVSCTRNDANTDAYTDNIETKRSENCEGKKTKETILPEISINLLRASSPDNKSVRSVSFQDGDSVKQEEDKESTTESRPSLRRRNSKGTVALQHLVDTTSGASKLRYLALLARKMESDSWLKPDTSQKEDNTFAGLENCRYLRVPSRGGNDE